LAAYTSSQTGNWASTSTWGGSGPPGDGDTVTIANTHTVTIAASTSVTVGNGADTATPAIATASAGTGILAIADGASLTIKSGVIQGNATWTIGAGCTITANNAAALTWLIGDAHSQANAKLTITGTSGSRTSIVGDGGGSYLKFSSGDKLRAGKMSAVYTDFQAIGNSSNAGFYPYLSTAGDTFSLKYCTLDADCGPIRTVTGINAGAVFEIEDSVFNATGENVGTTVFSNAISGGTYSIQRNRFEGTLGTEGGGGRWRDATIAHNLILSGLWSSSTTDENWASGSGNNLIRRKATEGVFSPSVSLTQANYWQWHNPAGSLSGIRWIYFRKVTGGVIRNQILEPGNTNSTGDLLQCSTPTGAVSHTIDHNLVLLNQAGDHTGQFVSLLGNSNVTLAAINHNTYPSTATGTESGAISYGETYAGHANMISAIKSNLVWDHTSGGGYVFQRRSTNTVADGCASGNITHNGKWNLSTGDQGEGYDDTAGSGMFSSGSPGASDVSLAADPFFDRTRNLATYAVAFAGSASGDTYNDKCADVYDYLDDDPATRIPHLIAWVKEGFKPTTATLQAAHDNTAPSNGWIGAIEGSTGPVKPVLFHRHYQTMGWR
jgi:hypothetical protein